MLSYMFSTELSSIYKLDIRRVSGDLESPARAKQEDEAKLKNKGFLSLDVTIQSKRSGN